MIPFLNSNASLSEEATQQEVEKRAAWVIRERPMRQCRAFSRELEQRVMASSLPENAAAFYEQQFQQKIPSTYYELPVVAKDGAERWLGQDQPAGRQR
jgi:hypothetical protein